MPTRITHLIRRTLPALLLTAMTLPLHAAPPAASAAATAPTALRCDLLPTPELTTIVNATPRFGWVMNAPDADEVQTAYQIQLAQTAAFANGTGVLWDTGKVASAQSVSIAYAGPALAANHEYWWRVRTADKHGSWGAWSAAQHIRTGDLTPVPAIGDGVARLPLTQTVVVPVADRVLPNGNRLLDFGRDAFAGLRLTIDGGENGGDQAFIGMGEALGPNGGVERKPPGSVRYHRTAIILAAGKHEYTVELTPNDARRMPPEIGPVMPFRYVEIESGAASAVSKPQQVVAHYPFDDGAARFTSSEPRLNGVWDLCAYSMKATSFCGVFVDGDRERLPYEADAYINQLGWYACAGEYALPRYTGEHLLTNTTWPTEWYLHSVLIAWADYLYTGDNQSLTRCYDDLKPKALADLEGADGLIRTVDPAPSPAVLAAAHAKKMQDIVDWPGGERDGYEMKPVNTVVNAFHYQALVDLASIADATGHTADAADFRARAGKVAAAINDKLFDPATGLYVDGEGSMHSALHANLFPLAFGIVPADRVPKVAAFLKSKGMACSVYAAQYLLEALYAAGEGDYALHLMLATDTERSWDYMANRSPATITMEAWAQHYKPNQDWTHAWGAAPANIIPRLLMGVEPLEPGFATVRIRPQIGALTRASLDLPTIRGPIHVDVARSSASAPMTLNVHIPANMRAEIWLPRGASTNANVTVDGKAHAGRIDGDWVVIAPVGSGAHSFVR